MNHNVDVFGKDHWALFAYLHTIESNTAGISEIDFKRLRVKKRDGWKPYYGTILKGGEIALDHDDLDCLDDFEKVGYIVVFNLENGYFALTHRGLEIAEKLKEHKSNGGSFSEFNFSEFNYE
jgi:hypothetical protein